MRLGGLNAQPQAQLDGFKSRTLRSAQAPTQRHLYLTEWRSLNAAGARDGATLVIGNEALFFECEPLSSRASRHELAATVGGGAWAVIATTVATQRGSLTRLPLFALEVALTLVQTQTTMTLVPNVWLLLAGDPSHSGTWGLARSARAEALLPLVSIHAPSTMVLTFGISSFTEPEAVLHASTSCLDANTCLDALASTRRAHGVTSASVQWGAWAEVGMAARGAASERMAAMEAASGFGRIGLAQGLAALGVAVLRESPSVQGVLPVMWSRFLGERAQVPAFLSVFAPKSKEVGATSLGAASVACSISLEAVLEMMMRTAGGSVDADAPLMEAGVDSLGAVELRNQLQNSAGVQSLPSTLVFDHPTARQLTSVLQPEELTSELAASTPVAAVSTGDSAGIDGLSGCIPLGASSVQNAHSMVVCGRNAIVQVPASRWDVHAQPALPEPMASRVRHTGFVRGAELADNAAFAVSPAEAAAMDPCQRLVLEFGYAALHDGGLDRADLSGSLTGVFLGFAGTEFAQVLTASPAGGSVYAATSSSASIAAGRLPYTFGLHGPCVSYDTACSAALAASHAGLRALQLAECNVGLVMGVTLVLAPGVGTSFAVAGMTSARGRSHTFDARADGYARGEACGGVVLSCGDGLLGLLGSAVRQDGRSASLTAPNGQAQQGLLVAALRDAATPAHALGLMEAHGTGTALGDPIEVGSLVAAVLSARALPLAVGGVKANIGHAEPAAGMTGLLKLALGLRAGQATPNAQLRSLNPHVGDTLHGAAGALPVVLAAVTIGSGGVSSFGYSGTIAHAVLAIARKGGREALAFARVPDSSEMLLFRSRCADEAGEPLGEKCSGMDTGRSTFERHPRPPLVYRRRTFLWRDAVDPSRTADASPITEAQHVPVAADIVRGRFVLPAAARAAFALHECHSDEQYVALAWDESMQVGVITLNDPAHFNALGGALAGDLARVVKHVSAMAHPRGFVLQADGPHFCIGGNPHDKHVDIPVTELAHNLLATAHGCCKLRDLLCPVTAAVHGHLAGGGIALCLSVSYRVADLSTTFEHGNLPRGVCPIAEFSQTLIHQVGQACAASFYMTHRVLSAGEALQLGLTEEAYHGTSYAQQRAQQVAHARTLCPRTVLTRANPGIIAREAFGHAECRVINRGEAKSTLPTEVVAHDMRWSEQRDASPLPRGSAQQVQPLLVIDRVGQFDGLVMLSTMEAAHKQLRMTASPVIILSLHNVCPSCTSMPDWVKGVDSVAEAQEEERRLSCCPRSDAWPIFEWKSMRTADALRRTALSFNEVTGVAAVELDGSDLVLALNAALHRVVRLGSAVRAVVFHIAGNSWPSARLSARTLVQTDRALHALHSLGIPVVCSADESVCGASLVAWSAADYRVAGQHLHAVLCGSTSERVSRPRERARQFATWLVHHPVIGLQHMLSLTRKRLASRPDNALSRDVMARTILLYSSGTRTEMRLLLAERSAQAEAHIVQAHRSLSFANIGGCSILSPVATLRKTAPAQSKENPSNGANLSALELYTPHQCASTATIQTHYGCSGLYTSGLHAGQYAACGEDEDAASMALTAMNRLLRRCRVRPAEVGVLHLSPSLLDRSKSMKTELMAMVETDAYADLEGVDHYGASAGRGSALMSCVSWAQSESWDGRWGAAVCSHDQVAPKGLPTPSAFAAAVLVGRGAPLRVCNVGEHVMEQPRFVSWMRIAPLPAGQPHKKHEMRATVHIGSRGEACQWFAVRGVKQVSAAQT
ncbi:enoyl-CoA hydratase-related protein [bacterium]|nr:enoyl-CoA hydratase-related protein [bacterium]